MRQAPPSKRRLCPPPPAARATRTRFLVLALAGALALAGCGSAQRPAGGERAAPQPSPSVPGAVSRSAPPPRSPGPAPADPAAVRANELGVVPILMYHQILTRPQGAYDETPAALRAELTRLARSGYVPVTAADYAAGRLDVPAGKHPVVLTFDDATVGQFSLGADGRPKPGTAVAILRQVAARYPGFTPTATFYVNREPFAGQPGALRWLADHGFDLGDHTRSHANLRELPPAAVAAQVRGNLAAIRRAVPGAAVTTMALPFGAVPRPPSLALRGPGYSFAAVMLVGSDPAPSPYSTDLDRSGVPRIRSGTVRDGQREYTSGWWLDVLARSPQRLFTSDGNPATISFPRRLAGELTPTLRGRADPY